MSESLVSIIIPVYNVEKYLKRCVDSVLNQTYKNLEIILVDDGSLDSSGKLCDEFATYDKRIRVIHQTNRGQAGARNTGLASCHGKFVGFVDSDDWIASDAYEYCLNLIEANNADVSQINFIYTKGSQEIKEIKSCIEIYEGKDILEYFMTTSTITGSYSVCRCLFKTVLLKDIKFREGKINEDIDYKYKVLSRCKKIVVSNQVKYFYFQDSSSTTRGGLKRKDFDLREAAEELWKLAKNEDYGNIRFLAKVKMSRSAFSFLCKIAYYGISDLAINEEQLVKELIAEHRKNLRILLKAPLPVSRKILSVGFALNFDLTRLCINLAKRLGY